MLPLLTEILRRTSAGETVVLATLVRSRGSTPQKTGAAMLVTASGQTLGTLGGGCTEAESRARALQLLAFADPKPQLLSFKLDNDYGWDDGLVCGGMMDVLLAPYAPATDNLPSVAKWAKSLSQRHTTRIELQLPQGETGDELFQFDIEPSPRLVIAGAGHVAHALAQIAGPAGFELTVIDDRPDQASPDRFPNATRIIGPIESELSKLSIDPATYIVIVTRGHKNDGAALTAVINSSAGYIGLIGSKRKVRTILGHLHDTGTPRERLAAVHAPIGLDIGAISPQEIAVSIVAELIATRRGKSLPAMQLPAPELDRWLQRPH